MGVKIYIKLLLHVIFPYIFFQDYFYCPLTAALQVLNDTTVKH